MRIRTNIFSLFTLYWLLELFHGKYTLAQYDVYEEIDDDEHPGIMHREQHYNPHINPESNSFQQQNENPYLPEVLPHQIHANFIDAANRNNYVEHDDNMFQFNSQVHDYAELNRGSPNEDRSEFKNRGETHLYGTSNENVDDLSYEPPLYQPRPGMVQSSTRDLNIILVPRLGLVRGIYSHQVIKNRLINAYLGLRYGTVRPGLGRFQKASPPETLDNHIDATNEPENCPQFPDLHLIAERERHGENVDDCLTLNIYTPAQPGPYPVLLFVHGEMLFDGSAAEGQPDYFLEHDITLVTVNYRLAPFGYISTLNDAMPGNVALADIQMALEWIQQHIRAFNGDPDEVTLMGQAGGATLVHALSLSAQAHGLFHKLILQSGTALNPYFLDEQPLNTIRSFAHYSRCPARRTVEDFQNCFEQMATTDILKNFKIFWEANESRGLILNSGYKMIVGDRSGYLPSHPASAVADNKYPLIIGATKDAGAFILSRFFKQLSMVRSGNVTDYINVVLKHTAQPRHYQLWKYWALEHIFTTDNKHKHTLSDIAHKLLELVNLILYRGPIIDSIRFTSKKFPTYMYCFDYRGEYHRFGHLSNVLPFGVDATLSDDNVYLFPFPSEVSQLNTEDKILARAMVSMWVQFVRHGVPHTYESAHIWPNVSNEYGPFLRFTNNLLMNTPNFVTDYHFTDGVPVPKLYPEYFTTTTTTTTTTAMPPHSNYDSPYSLHTDYKAHQHVLKKPNEDELPQSIMKRHSQSAR